MLHYDWRSCLALTVSGLRSKFVLAPEVAYLNHGGFGAVPADVLDERESWLRHIDRNPTAFFERELDMLLGRAMSELAYELDTSVETLAWMPNATFALNLIARSVMNDLRPGDEVLLTDVEYGAQYPLWRWVCEQTGATLRIAGVYRDRSGDRAGRILESVTPRTRVLLMSHITSATALLLPVREVCGALAGRDVTTIVDGAHAPGQIDFRPATIGCDYYVGDLHKWQVAPRGSAFLYASKDRQRKTEPLVIGWAGVDPARSLSERTRRPGTSDPSAWLSVPRALEFHRQYLLPTAPAAKDRLRRALCGLDALGFRPLSAPEREGLLMASLALPGRCAPGALSDALMRDKVEAVLTTHGQRDATAETLLRISVAWYTSDDDIDRLLACCKKASG